MESMYIIGVALGLGLIVIGAGLGIGRFTAAAGGLQAGQQPMGKQGSLAAAHYCSSLSRRMLPRTRTSISVAMKQQ